MILQYQFAYGHIIAFDEACFTHGTECMHYDSNHQVFFIMKILYVVWWQMRKWKGDELDLTDLTYVYFWFTVS